MQVTVIEAAAIERFTANAALTSKSGIDAVP